MSTWTIEAAQDAVQRIKIQPHLLAPGGGTIPAQNPARLDEIRQWLANRSGRLSLSILIAMGESAVIMQLRYIIRQTKIHYHRPGATPWQAIQNCLVSETQLAILTDYFGLRDFLLPEPDRRHRSMNGEAYNSRLFLVYVAVYAQTLSPNEPMLWLRENVIMLINAYVSQWLNNKVYMGIPRLAELESVTLKNDQTSAGSDQGGEGNAEEGEVNGETNREQDGNQDTQQNNPPHPYAFQTLVLPKAQPPCAILNMVVNDGWKYYESEIEADGVKFWLVVLSATGMAPVTLIRQEHAQARSDLSKYVAANPEYVPCLLPTRMDRPTTD